MKFEKMSALRGKVVLEAAMSVHRLETLARHVAGSQPFVQSLSPSPTAAGGQRPPVTSHVLDTGTGKPAQGVSVLLEVLDPAGVWQRIGSDSTNSDGRCPKLLSVEHQLRPGTYRCTFDTKSYYSAMGQTCFYPEVPIIFEIKAVNEHYHIPLLINAFGFSTYRGS